MNPLKGELEYGSISLDDKEDYRLYRYSDAGMGETEYRIFRNGAFFAMFDNRKDAEEVMTVMTHKSEREKVLDEYNGELLTKLVRELAGTWRMRDAKLFSIIRKYRRVPIGAMKAELRQAGSP